MMKSMAICQYHSNTINYGYSSPPSSQISTATSSVGEQLMWIQYYI